MNSKYKAWQLAVALRLWLIKTGCKSADAFDLKQSLCFEVVGTDDRTIKKYWGMMMRAEYIESIEEEGKGVQFKIVDNIEELKPKSLGQMIEQMKAEIKGNPVPKQTQFGVEG